MPISARQLAVLDAVFANRSLAAAKKEAGLSLSNSRSGFRSLFQSAAVREEVQRRLSQGFRLPPRAALAYAKSAGNAVDPKRVEAVKRIFARACNDAIAALIL